MEGAVSKAVAAWPHWAAGLPAVIWVSRMLWVCHVKILIDDECELSVRIIFLHWTNVKQPIVFTNPWPIFSAVLSLIFCSLPSEAQRKMLEV